MRLYIIRHGETEWNKVKRLQGQTDIPLAEEGIRLARETGEGMKNLPIDLVISSPLTRAVQKIWAKDENSKKDRPEKIVVDIYMDNENTPYDTVTLNVANNWKYTWHDLPVGHKWTVAEKEVPAHYKVSITAEGNIISITNEYTKPEIPPPPPHIPQTGQLWWPVPLLAMLGTVFFAIGWARRRDGESK